MLPAINFIVLPTEWSLAVVNCINEHVTVMEQTFPINCMRNQLLCEIRIANANVADKQMPQTRQQEKRSYPRSPSTNTLNKVPTKKLRDRAVK